MEILKIEPPLEAAHVEQTREQSTRLAEKDRVQLDASKLSATPKAAERSEFAKSETGLSNALNNAVRRFGATELKVRLDETTDGPIFTIVDKATGEELLQIPSEYQLSVERAVEIIRGALFDKSV